MENKNENCNIHVTIIIILLIIIAVGGFFVGKNYDTLFVNNNSNNTSTDTTVKSKDLSLLVIDDARCTSCQTDVITSKLKEIPVLATASFEKKDFSDEGIKEYMEENSITTLPAFIFNSNQVDQSINQYLQELPSKEYSLQIGATFDPFIERSEKGFLLLDEDKYSEIKKASYIKGNTEAKITWLEYSDLECPFCAKLHTSGTPEEITQKYGDDINIIYNHFPLDFHKNAMSGAQILECIGELNGSDAFYTVLENSYAGRDVNNQEDHTRQSGKDFLIDEAVKAGVNKVSLEKCIDEGKYEEKIKTEQTMGSELFGITGTPGNVLINNETGEYEVISGAYPTDSFITIIDKLLK